MMHVVRMMYAEKRMMYVVKSGYYLIGQEMIENECYKLSKTKSQNISTPRIDFTSNLQIK